MRLPDEKLLDLAADLGRPELKVAMFDAGSIPKLRALVLEALRLRKLVEDLKAIPAFGNQTILIRDAEADIDGALTRPLTHD